MCRFLQWRLTMAEVVDIPIKPLPNGQPLPPTPGVVAELEVLERFCFDPASGAVTPYTIGGTTEFSAEDDDDRTEWLSSD